MKKIFLFTLFIAIAVSLFFGISRFKNNAANHTISILVFGTPEELKAFRTVIKAFHTSQKNTRVQLIEAQDRTDLLARLSTSFANNNPPDLFLLNYRYLPQFAAKNVLEPLDDRLQASDAFKASDFYQQALEAFMFNGKQVCLPQNISSLVVYYNRTMFQDAGVPEPSADWHWDEMVSKAKALTRDTNGDGEIDKRGLGMEPGIIRLAPFIWSNGGKLVDDPNKPTRFALTEQESLTALEKFLDLHDKHQVVPNEIEFESEHNVSRFINGELAMVLDSRRATPTFRTIKNFDWDVAPLPRLQEQASVLHSDGYCMTTASKNKPAAWHFMEFALGAEGQRIIAGTGRTVPSLIKVAESDAFLDKKQKPAHSQVFLDTIPYIQKLPTVSTWSEIEKKVNIILELSLYKEGEYITASPEKVARDIESITEPLFKRAE